MKIDYTKNILSCHTTKNITLIHLAVYILIFEYLNITYNYGYYHRIYLYFFTTGAVEPVTHRILDTDLDELSEPIKGGSVLDPVPPAVDGRVPDLLLKAGAADSSLEDRVVGWAPCAPVFI